jgi:hypothetical protein
VDASRLDEPRCVGNTQAVGGLCRTAARARPEQEREQRGEVSGCRALFLLPLGRSGLEGLMWRSTDGREDLEGKVLAKVLFTEDEGFD